MFSMVIVLLEYFDILFLSGKNSQPYNKCLLLMPALCLTLSGTYIMVKIMLA